MVIGANCKIGPNCELLVSTAIGDNCHIGQSVEIKNPVSGASRQKQIPGNDQVVEESAAHLVVGGGGGDFGGIEVH